jgi:hypothetical protein
LSPAEERCVEAETAEEARQLLALGEGHRCHLGGRLHEEVQEVGDSEDWIDGGVADGLARQSGHWCRLPHRCSCTLGLVVLLNGLPPSAPFEFQDWTRFGVGLVKTLFFVALPIWLAARLLDFVIGGPAKRKAKQKSN